MKLKLNAIPLRISDWSETSQVVTLLSDKFGKISAVAKGAYRSKSMFDGPFDHLCHYQVIWLRNHRSGLGQITESYQYSRPLIFRTQLKTQFFALSCVERALELVEEEQPTSAYLELRFALGRMVQGDDPQRVHNDFTIRLMRDLGFGPVTQYCVVNGRPREHRGDVAFSSRLGGVISPECLQHDPQAIIVTNDMIQRIDSVNDGSGNALNLSGREEKKLTRLMTECVQHQIGKALRTARYCHFVFMLLMMSFLSSCYDDRPAQVIYEDAVSLYEQNKYIRASWRVDALMEQYPENPLTPEVLWIKALDEQRRDDDGEFRGTLLDLLERYPDHQDYYRALNLLFENLKMIFEANAVREDGRLKYDVNENLLEAMEEVSSYAPYSQLADEALMYVANARLAKQEYEEAEFIYRQILMRVDRNSPLEIEAQYKLAMSIWDRAVIRIRGFFDRHLRNPTEELSLSDRKIAVRYSDRYPTEAAREFREVIRRFPDSEQAALSRKILVEIDKLKAVRLLTLGDFYRFYGKIDSARYYYRRLIQLYPDDEIARQAQVSLDEILEE